MNNIHYFLFCVNNIYHFFYPVFMASYIPIFITILLTILGIGTSVEDGASESYILDIIKGLIEKISNGDDVTKVSIPSIFIEVVSNHVLIYTSIITLSHFLNAGFETFCFSAKITFRKIHRYIHASSTFARVCSSTRDRHDIYK